jgi:hypothetical protein
MLAKGDWSPGVDQKKYLNDNLINKNTTKLNEILKGKKEFSINVNTAGAGKRMPSLSCANLVSSDIKRAVTNHR